MVLRHDFSPQRLSMGDSHQEGYLLTGRGHDLSPLLRVVEAVGVAPEGAQLIASGLSTEVAETILQSPIRRAGLTISKTADLLGWVKCREHISLLVILCIIMYVTNKKTFYIMYTYIHTVICNSATDYT